MYMLGGSGAPVVSRCVQFQCFSEGLHCGCAAHAMPEWRGKDSFAAEAASFGEIDLRARAENMPVALSMRVVSAPASFALPMVQRKVFKPPFTVRARLQLSPTCESCCL